MKVTFLYHSGFAVEFEDVMLIFDYYKGELPPSAEGKKLYVFASHFHKDHFQRQILDWSEKMDVTYILSKDIRVKGFEGNVLKVRGREEIQVDELKIKTLRSTDVGVAFFVRLKGVTIYHAGDLNWWHWKEEGPAYNENMRVNYQKEIQRIEDEHIDLAFVPLDPRLEDAYGWGFDYFMKHTDTEYVFPMHLWGSYKTIVRFMDDPLSEEYRDRIVKVERRQQSFEIPRNEES